MMAPVVALRWALFGAILLNFLIVRAMLQARARLRLRRAVLPLAYSFMHRRRFRRRAPLRWSRRSRASRRARC